MGANGEVKFRMLTESQSSREKRRREIVSERERETEENKRKKRKKMRRKKSLFWVRMGRKIVFFLVVWRAAKFFFPFKFSFLPLVFLMFKSISAIHFSLTVKNIILDSKIIKKYLMETTIWIYIYIYIWSGLTLMPPHVFFSDFLYRCPHGINCND